MFNLWEWLTSTAYDTLGLVGSSLRDCLAVALVSWPLFVWAGILIRLFIYLVSLIISRIKRKK